MIAIPSFPVTNASILDDKDYFINLRKEIKNANHRIWASIFIIDARINQDTNLLVRKILSDLEIAHLNGLDVRIIIGSSKIKDLFIVPHRV